MVTVALFAIVFVPVAAVFSGALNASTSNANQQNAAMLAASVIAKLRAAGGTATGYSTIGFGATTIAGAGSSYATAVSSGPSTSYYWDSDGDADQFGSVPDDSSGTNDRGDEQLVVLRPSTTPPSFTLGSSQTPFAPVMPGVVSGGGTYTVTTHVLYSSSTSRGCPGTGVALLTQAYKRVFVTVTWRNGTAVVQSLKQDQVLYPGGLVPYHGPQYNPANIPPPPTSVTASTGTPETTGQLDISFTVPTTWSATGMCFAIGWVDTNQVVYSTGIVANNDPGWVVPPQANGTATFGVSGLVQGAIYVMFVTAFSGDGIESNESADSATVQSPTGPLISGVADAGDAGFSPAYGQSGTQLQVTGSGFMPGNGTTSFYLVPGTVTNPSTYSSYPAATNVNCSSATSCTLTMPGPCLAPACPLSTTNVVNLVAETVPTAGGPTVASPTVLGDQVSYAPIVTGLNPASGNAGGGYSVQVAIRNFYANANGGTDLAVGGQDTTGSQSCTQAAPVTTCTIRIPPGTAGTSVYVTATTGSNPPFTSANSAANLFTYTS